MTRVTGVTRGEGTEGRGEGGGEGEEILAGGRAGGDTDQSMVVQEFLVDLKI